MIYPWFHITQRDRSYYREHLEPRMPARILDAHVHMNLEEHVKDVPQERKEDWAVETGLHMDLEAANHYYSTMLPGVEMELNVFPFPLPEVDIPGNNEYLGALADGGKVRAMMSVRPEWTGEYCEEILLSHRFSGFKPYPYLAAREKGADISIYDFMPPHQMEVLDRHKGVMMLHLPRHGRLPHPDNIRELREMRQRYPDIRIILAHLGRCFDPLFFQKAMEALGNDRNSFYYDCAAVTGREVLAQALEALDTERILFGSDQPIFLWHGWQTWNQGGSAVNFAREEFSWNKEHASPGEEEKYVYIAYIQLKNLLDAIGRNEAAKELIFYENARRVLSGPGEKQQQHTEPTERERWK